MSTTTTTPDEDLTNKLIRFYRERYQEAIAELAQHYPKEQVSLVVDYDDLYEYDRGFAEDYLAEPEQLAEYLEEALRLYDLPADVSLSSAHVRVQNLPGERTFYPGEFSPTDYAGQYAAITGEVSKATDQYSKIVEAAFECERCGTMSFIPMGDGGFQEPHECQGCERQGPFSINLDKSDFVDAQQLRVATPPEIASGAGQEIDVFVEDDLADRATIGDRVTIAGTIHLEQQTNGRQKTGKFEPYLDGNHISVKQTDHTDLDIDPGERERIHEVAAGEEGDPIDSAAQSLAPKIYGYEHIKRMLVLSMVGGSRIEYSDGDHDRGEFHVLLLGDPGTAKSKLIDRVEELGWRTVGISGKGATTAGTTATASQDNFGDGEWTLSAGAFVKANEGTVCIDELDDMPADVRAAMLEPMSKQSIHITKAGINTKLRTQTGVVAAGNPKYGRFDPYEDVHDQFDLGSTLLSRFDLIFTLTDQPDPDRDSNITGHILDARDAAKRQMTGREIDDDQEETISTPIDPSLLRKWVALAKQQPAPVFADDDVKQWLQDSFNDLRSLHGYDEESPVPVTFRKLEGIVRIAEAAAMFEFSETIEMRHARIAAKAVGQSIQDYGKNEDGELDADVQESGTSKAQRDKIKILEEVVQELQPAKSSDGADVEAVIEELENEGVRTGYDLIDQVKERGWAYQPNGDDIRWVGRA